MALSEEYKKTVSENPLMLQIGETPEQYNARNKTTDDTAGSLGMTGLTTLTPDEKEIEKIQSQRFANLSPIDETAVRKEVADRFQAEIDALNAEKAIRKAELAQKYQGIEKRRLGSKTALLAGAGMLGQVSGAGELEDVRTTTGKELGEAQSAVEREYAQRVSNLMSEARTLAESEIARKQNALESGTSAYVDYLRTRGTERQNRLNTFVSSALTQGIDLTKDTNLAEYAKQLGVAPEAITTSYLQAKATAEESQAKKELETKKTENELKIQEADIASKQWKLENDKTLSPLEKQKLEADIAKSRADIAKTYADISSSKSGGLTTAQINSTINSIAQTFDNEPIVKNYNTAQEGYQTIKSIGTNTKNPADDINFIYSFAKIMDPNSVVREGEYNTVQKYAQTWADSFGFKAKRIFSNTNFLSKEAKENMLNTLESKVKTLTNQYNNAKEEYNRRIEEVKSGGFNTLPDYSKAFSNEDINDNYQQYRSQLQKGEILVRDKKTGQIGAIPESEFNSSLYEKQ